MCLNDGSQSSSVYRDQEGSKNESLKTLGYLSSTRHPEGSTCEVRLKPVECSSVDVQQWEFGEGTADISSRMRTEDLDSALALLSD